MEWMERVQTLYESYLSQTLRLGKKRKLTDGFMGLGNSPSKDRCHSEFGEDLEALLGELLAAGVAEAERETVLDYIYRAPLELKGGAAADWMLLAVHNLTKPLAEGLSPDTARRLGEWYSGAYRKERRLPCQQEVLKLLKKRAN